MHALLGMSAAHLSWLTNCNSALQLSYEHKGVALYGLKEAVGQFTKENADGILAASMLLSWQATEPYVLFSFHVVEQKLIVFLDRAGLF